MGARSFGTEGAYLATDEKPGKGLPMMFFETGLLLFFALWLLCVIWAALGGNGRLLRLRKFLWFNGWFSQWTMFVPGRAGKTESFTISYRDQTADDQIGPWQVIKLEKTWRPTLFLINPDIRLYGFMLNALYSFAHLQDIGRSARESSHFNFFHSIILSYRSDKEAAFRQIKVERCIGEEGGVLLQSDFLKLP